MAGVTIEDVTLPTLQVNADEYRKFCQYANQVFTNPFFELLRKELVNKQLEKTCLEARDYEATQFGRATISGVLLWEEIFNEYSLQFESQFLKKNKDFNPSKGFESIS